MGDSTAVGQHYLSDIMNTGVAHAQTWGRATNMNPDLYNFWVEGVFQFNSACNFKGAIAQYWEDHHNLWSVKLYDDHCSSTVADRNYMIVCSCVVLHFSKHDTHRVSVSVIAGSTGGLGIDHVNELNLVQWDKVPIIDNRTEEQKEADLPIDRRTSNAL